MTNRGEILAAFAALVLILTGATAAFPDEGADSEPASQEGHHERFQDEPILSPRELMPRAPSARVQQGPFQSVQVNVDSQGNNIVGDAANEPSIAIDPTDPNNIVIGWRQFDNVASNFRQAGMSYSHDGGRTWTFPGVLQPGQFRSDPVLDTDSQGIFYYNSLSTITTGDMFISEDKGVTWMGPIPAFGGDKNWMTIDKSGSIGDRNIYPIWNSQFTCCGFGTDYTRSLDDGVTYQGPFATPQKPKWGTVAVGPDGELYFVGARTNDTSQHIVLKSSSARDPFETPIFEQVTSINLGGETGTNGVPNPGGLMGQVWVAVDQSDLPTRGHVYVLASVDPPGPDPMDVNAVISTDGGATFSMPERVNHDPSDPTSWQWFGTMSVAPNGRVDVVWNDTSQTDSALESALYYAYSRRSGLKFSDALQVSPVFNSVIGHPNQNKIGDYYDMRSDNVGAGLAYAATFNGEQDVYFLRVGDCNDSGLHDMEDIIADGTIDCNRNGVLDACEGFECPPCDLDSQCTDGLFCNGVETCDSEQCRPGTPPDCGDGDLCTQDLCDVGTDQCVNPPVLTPTPAEDVLTGKESPDSDVAIFDWNAVAGADAYNMYRGVQQDLGDLSCLIPGITGTSSPDDGQLPLPDEVFYYAISAENCAGESTLGTDSEGNDRTNTDPCF